MNILIEPKDYKLDISDNILKFIQDDYEFKMEFKHDVDNNFKCNENRILEIDIIKVVPNFWDHLIKDHNSMKNNISINWDRWIDEDEDDDLLHLNLGSDTSEDDENLEYEQQTEPEAEIELGQESEPQTLNSSN